MPGFAEPITTLIRQLCKLPGVGEKTASRLAFFLLRLPREEVEELARSLLAVKEKIQSCPVCFNLTDVVPCEICRDDRRSDGVLCVVEEPADLFAIERTRQFRGRFHVLQGAIRPLDGVGPEDLKIRELLERLQDGKVQEVLIATNPTTEGDATALYLSRLVKPLGVRVTRIAYGVPMGGDLEYADQVTLGKAIEGRREM
ncbi:MAG: recombination protein RecR [Deltaproteobacteria bacterium]|nr:recombination protein RecR [Deltaproteobacteria bacterium]